MNFPRLIVSFACITLFAATLPAQNPNAPTQQTPSIAPDQRAKLKAAYVKAAQDPKVVAAQADVLKAWDNYRAIVKKKILASDASMGPILDKADQISAAQATGQQPPATLTPDEKKSFHDALQKIETDPDVKAAQSKMQDLKKTKDALMRAAIIQADPTLEPVLEEIDKFNKQAQAPAPAGQ